MRTGNKELKLKWRIPRNFTFFMIVPKIFNEGTSEEWNYLDKSEVGKFSARHVIFIHFHFFAIWCLWKGIFFERNTVFFFLQPIIMQANWELKEIPNPKGREQISNPTWRLCWSDLPSPVKSSYSLLLSNRKTQLHYFLYIYGSKLSMGISHGHGKALILGWLLEPLWDTQRFNYERSYWQL